MPLLPVIPIVCNPLLSVRNSAYPPSEFNPFVGKYLVTDQPLFMYPSFKIAQVPGYPVTSLKEAGREITNGSFLQAQGGSMKVRACLVLTLLLLSADLPAVFGEEYGKIRPLNQRAAELVRQRNDFVEQVLTAYGVAHVLNRQGAVVRIQVDGRWRDIKAIEIVPQVEQRDQQRQVTAHELVFTTADGGILSLRSELQIR
jgi:hypothetical protein